MKKLSQVEHLRFLLKEAEEVITIFLDDAGACDHSVGVCLCHPRQVLENIHRELVKDAK
jgi:hypothetical protein